MPLQYKARHTKGTIAAAGLGMPVSPQGTDPHTSGTAGTCQMSARSPQGLLCKGQAPSQEEGGFRLAAGWLAVMLRQPTLAAARAEAAFGRWLLLAEGPFPVLFWSVAGRSWAGGSHDSPLRSLLARSCTQVIKTLTTGAQRDGIGGLSLQSKGVKTPGTC